MKTLDSKMGWFSWWTIKYNGNLSRPIYKRGGKKLPVFNVWMHTPDGKSYHETEYEGYGEFGGKDYFVALSECNPEGGTEQLTQEQHRERGVDLEYENRETLHLKFPVFTETATYDGTYEQCNRIDNQGTSWEDKEELRAAYIELEDLKAESKRLRDCLQKYTDDEEQLTGKRRRVPDE